MPVHRERTDPVRTPEGLTLVHRRWLLPDDVERPVALQQLSHLWRGLGDLAAIDPAAEVTLERLVLPPSGELVQQEMPALASAGALLASTGSATLLTQVVWPDEEGLRDPYAQDGEPDQPGFRDYTLYAVDHAGFLLVPLVPQELICGACGAVARPALTRFGEGALFDRAATCSACGAVRDPARDRARLRTGAVFLLEELVCRAALSIELPRAPAAEELPDAAVANLLREAMGSYDELSDDGVPPAE
jgi:hypothetical protein